MRFAWLTVLVLAGACLRPVSELDGRIDGGRDAGTTERDAGHGDAGHADGSVDAGLVDACVPSSCAAVAAECGTVDDGCGGTLDCGTCASPTQCAANRCEPCRPTTCALAGKDCGFLSDGCGQFLDCGTCAGFDTCGAVTPNVCGCVRATCASRGAVCGSLPDGCGGPRADCGTCPADMTCGAVRPGQCTPRKPCTPLGWCAELPRHPLDVSDLYSATPNSIWAAGTTVMHWDGTSWSTVGLDAGGISSTVWGFGDDDVWVGGQNLSHWDGFEWKTLAAPGFGFRGIHGTRPDDVWFTEMRAVLRWNGRSFTRWDVGMPQSTFVPGEVWSFSAQDVWAGSFHFTGSAWVVYQPQPIINYGPEEVWGAAPNDLWGVVPQTSQIWHWDGGAWSLARDNELPSSVYGTAADDVWFTSRDVLHFDGVQLSPVMPNRFTTVFALERGKPLLANYFGEVVRLELDAGVTTLSAPLSSPIVDATWTTSDGWAVSDRALLRFDGTFWRDAPLPPTSGHLTAVAAAGAYAWVGTRNATSLGGELLTWDGATWSSALLSSVVDALWANSPTDVWVFCRDELRHWDGVIWTSTPRPAAMRSPVLEAWSNGTMLVALTTGSFLSWNGSMWTEEQLAPSGTLRSFAVRSPSDMWAVGASVVFHFDGTFWNVVSFRPPDPMIGVAAVGNRKAWLFTETQIYEVNLAMPPPLRLINTDLEPTTFRSVEHSGNEFRVMTTNSILRAP